MICNNREDSLRALILQDAAEDPWSFLPNIIVLFWSILMSALRWSTADYLWFLLKQRPEQDRDSCCRWAPERWPFLSPAAFSNIPAIAERLF